MLRPSLRNAQVGGDQVAESLFKPYTAQIDSCDDKAQNDECAKTTTDFISFISKSCCDANDSSQCDGLPADCTPECGAVFMPYFSRCGRLVFQAPDALSHAGVNAPNADGTPSQVPIAIDKIRNWTSYSLHSLTHSSVD